MVQSRLEKGKTGGEMKLKLLIALFLLLTSAYPPIELTRYILHYYTYQSVEWLQSSLQLELLFIWFSYILFWLLISYLLFRVKIGGVGWIIPNGYRKK